MTSVFKTPQNNTNALVKAKAENLSMGRPRLAFENKSLRSQQRDAFGLSKKYQHNPNLMVKAACIAARHSGQKDLSVVLKEAAVSPSRPAKMKRFLSPEKLKEPVPYTPQEALAYLLENNFTKTQYINTRIGAKERNCDIYPSYENILQAKKECRPNGIQISETTASVPLADLLNHTISRIILLQENVLINLFEFLNCTNMRATMICSYGFDGSSGHSNYKQKFSNSSCDDSSIFATTVIPLRLVSSKNDVLWDNPTPQSTRFCRPLKIQYTKETKNHVLKEKADLDEQVKKLSPLECKVGNHILEITCKLCLTVIDGKILSILTNTKSSQACPICGATPSTFMKVKDFKSAIFTPNPDSLQYGISPLHCWIRFLECVLHIGYRIEIKVWQIKGESNKLVVNERKKNIQNQFWEKLSLHVDKPKPNYGSSNDGNTARRAFENPDIFSEITGVSLELITKFQTILIALACRLPLDLEKFETHCFNTGTLFISLYPWFPMPASIHKVLVHGKQIIENCLLPVGYFGEDAAESRNKLYKQDRLHHARKTSRISNLEDVFCRGLDTSDPLISSASLRSRKRNFKIKNLPSAVIGLLKALDLETSLDLAPNDIEKSKNEPNLNLDNLEDILDIRALETLELSSKMNF